MQYHGSTKSSHAEGLAWPRRLGARRPFCAFVPKLFWALVAVALAAPAFADDSRWRTTTLAADTPFATQAIIQQAGMPGPVMLIVGGMHGDEPAGAAAAEQIAGWPITRGTLIVVPRANVPALTANLRKSPDVEEEQANLNRNFVVAELGVETRGIETRGIETRGIVAADLWRLVEQYQPDWVIDLHEGFDVHARNSQSVGSSIIHDQSEQADAMATAMLAAVNSEVSDAADHFVPLGPPVTGSLTRAAAERTPARAMILETTKKDRRLSQRTRQHRIMVATLLARLEMIDDDVNANTIIAEPREATLLRVAVYDDAGASLNGVAALLRLCGKNELIAGGQLEPRSILSRRVSAEDIQAGALEQFDVVCFGGGGGRNLSNSLGESGRLAVREFVDAGGDYIGVCAGSYLACSGFSWGLAILDARTKSNKWRRGKAKLEVEFEPAGVEFFQTPSTATAGNRRKLYYANGPILAPDDRPDIADFQTLATFAEEIARNGTPPGIMINSPAIVRGVFGAGDVWCFGPHPELTAGAESLLLRALMEQESGVR